MEGFEKTGRRFGKNCKSDKIEKSRDIRTQINWIICQVNIGAETIQIVTGAPNVKEGDKVPVVLDGGRVAGGHE